VLKDGFANISPRGSTQVFDDDTLAARRADLGIKVYAAEPEGYDDMARSLELGERQENLSSPPTLCDALQAATPGEVTFAAARETLAGGFVVSDAEVRTAMERAFQDLKIVLEPSGAAALAAVLAGKIEVREKCVGVVASGGNVALEDFRRATA
jgi:threonine dehydratase